MKALTHLALSAAMLIVLGACNRSEKLIAFDIDSLRASVKNEALWAWQSYKTHAMGHDELNPLEPGYRDWYRESLLMTPVDALDMLLIMGEKDEADSIKAFLLKNLSFDKDIYVKNFEITIRFLGGLLSAYELTGDSALLGKAVELANRLLPAYQTPTGMPYAMVNLKTGAVRDSLTNPAEIASNILELGTLSRYTGKPVYMQTANKAIHALFELRNPTTNLVREQINAYSGEWKSSSAHIGCCIDSYYEYLLKGAILFNDSDLLSMWKTHKSAIDRYIPENIGGRLWYGRVDLNSGEKTNPLYGSLDAYYPALLALNGNLEDAANLQESSHFMWTHFGLEPEIFNYKTMEVVSGGYPLRPEIIESAYYLYQYTRDPKYLLMGKRYFEDLVKYCKTPYGYAALKDVQTREKAPSMESFLFAETFKYLYLLFSPDSTLQFDKVIFTTEAHPLKRN